jgi:hypothetical protein
MIYNKQLIADELDAEPQRRRKVATMHVQALLGDGSHGFCARWPTILCRTRLATLIVA